MFDLQIVPGVDLITREKVPKQNRPNKNKYQSLVIFSSLSVTL